MKTLSIKEKAVKINLSSKYYGTVAEIGGGQETARHLFQAGGASNTVAKSVSAYDKRFSDHFYNDGKPSRYVSRERLSKMVDHEYQELISILGTDFDQRFFSFANTCEVLNYRKNNRGHGWLGVAVQGSQLNNPNRIFIHVKLHENDTLLQQYTLGTLGVNLIYAGLFILDDPSSIIQSLLDNLDNERVEIDYIHVDGPDMIGIDNRLLNVKLVKNNMTPAIMFDRDGTVQQPSDMLFKKNVLVVRGYFRPISNLGMDFINNSLDVFARDEDYEPDNTIAFSEISLNYLMHGEQFDEKDFLNRVDLLNMVGQCVMVSRMNKFYELVEYFSQFKMIKLRIVVGLPTFTRILDESFYSDLRGGLLEAMGRLFQSNVKIYLYPSIDKTTDKVLYPEDVSFKSHEKILLDYLLTQRKIIVLRNPDTHNLTITTEKLTRLIEEGDNRFKELVPDVVYRYIVENRLFGYKTGG
jgi:hypothetical protein